MKEEEPVVKVTAPNVKIQNPPSSPKILSPEEPASPEPTHVVFTAYNEKDGGHLDETP